MKNALRASGLLGSFMVVLVASSLLVAQDAKKPAKAKNRLPTNYGKLDLSEEQRTKIYGVQASYDPKIDDLTAQLNALKAKQTSEIEAILKPEQLKKLTELRAAAKAKSAADAAAKKAAADAGKSKDAAKTPAAPATDGKKTPEKK